MPAVRPRPAPVPAALVALLTLACGGGSGMNAVIEHPPPVTAPPRFVPLDSTTVVAPADTLAGEGCWSPMVDPITRIQIVLVRSESGLGDWRRACSGR